MGRSQQSITRPFKRLGKAFLIFIFITIVAATLLIQTSGDKDFHYSPDRPVVNDITGLNPVSVQREIIPVQLEEITDAIKNSTGVISIGGGRFSQGGQTAYEDSLHIDMRQFNQVLAFDAEERVITVQPGITWRSIQEYIDPHNLSIRIMQSLNGQGAGMEPGYDRCRDR